MNKAILILATVLTGCAATQLQHTPTTNMTVADAQLLIEQVLMEQPPQYRPQGVVFTETYWGTSDGVKAVGKSSGISIPAGGVSLTMGDSKSINKELTTRIYYSSMGETKLYKKRDWHVIDIHNSDGYRMLRAYSTNEAKAHQFVDAMAVLTSAIPKSKQ